MTARRPLAVAGSIVAAALAVLLWLMRGHGAAAVARPHNPALDRFPRLAAMVTAAVPSARADRAGLHLLADPTLPLLVADYLVASRFPPESRPLTAGMLDLIEPNRREETPDAVKLADRTLGDPSLQVLWTGDHFRLYGDQRMAVWLEVTRDGARVPVTVRAARAMAVSIVGRTPVGAPLDLPLTEDGSHIWSGSFAVAGTPLARHVGYVDLEVSYDFGGPRPALARIEVYVQPDDPPARFTGRYREAIVKGSLVVYAGVEVARAGDYVFDANLFDRDGEPTAFVRWKGSLGVGAAEVPLLLYGRIVHEQDAAAPFTVTDLRGYRFRFGENPDRELMPDAPDEHVTGAYGRDQFTSDEYWDAAKQAHVDALLEEARQGAKTIARTTLGEGIEAGWEP